MAQEGLVQRATNTGTHVIAHEGLGHQIGGMGGIAAAFSSYPAALLTLGTTAAVSTVLMQMEYNQERKAIRRLYENELSAKLGKSRGALRHKDLDALARGDGENLHSNRTIAEALKSARKKRNFGVGIAVIASLGSLTLMGIAFGPAGLAGHGIAHAVVEGLSWGAWIAQGAIGFFTYQAIKAPLRWISNTFFGLEKETAHDHIIAIHRDRAKGRFITREQVFSVFACANEELGAMIKAQYGKEYDKLPLAVKQVVAISIGRMIALDKITDAINQGRMNPTELAFTAQGEASGFDPSLERHSKGLIGRIRDRLLNHKPGTAAHQAMETPVMPVYSNEAPQVSFVERLNQSRAAEASLLQQR